MRKIILPDPHKRYGELRLSESYSPALLSTDYKSPHLIIEIFDEMNYLKESKNDWQTIVGSKQANAFRGHIDGISPCMTEAMGMGGGQIPLLTNATIEESPIISSRKPRNLQFLGGIDVPFLFHCKVTEFFSKKKQTFFEKIFLFLIFLYINHYL